MILEYFSRHVGAYVKGKRLRFLTGDQVRTERRLRELRELGFIIIAERVSGVECHKLQFLSQNFDQAVRSQVLLLAKRSGSIFSQHDA